PSGCRRRCSARSGRRRRSTGSRPPAGLPGRRSGAPAPPPADPTSRRRAGSSGPPPCGRGRATAARSRAHHSAPGRALYSRAVTPLAGTVVLDLTQNVAGPFCTQILGDLGAEVVKVERPGRGDETRAWAPPRWGSESAAFLALNRNKRSLALDVKAAEAREILGRLARRADVLVQSFRPGGAEALGVDAATTRAANPRLVHCSVTAFGTRGPLRDLPGYDPMMQAYAGLMSLTGHPGQPPTRAGTSLVDMGTGMWAAIAILAALRERDRTGRGSEVTTALFDTALAWIPYQLLGYLGSGRVPGPHGSGAGIIVPYQAFPTADGWLMIAAPTDALFGRLCDALGCPALAADPRFASNPVRVEHRAALITRLEEETRRVPTAALLERLRGAGVPC